MRIDAYHTVVALEPPSIIGSCGLAEPKGDAAPNFFEATSALRVDAGVTAISVSNHGGNNVDGTPAPIRVVPEVKAAVRDQIEVVMDGGVRRGSDVVKALALGAKAVMIGRAYLWGLADIIIPVGFSPPPHG